MLLETRDIKNEFYFLNGYEKKISFLKDKYKGKNCFILAPGPSLKNLKIEEMKKELKESLVFCVKGTYLEYSNFCDFHFLNDCNLPSGNGYIGFKYDTGSDPIIVASSGFDEPTARERFGSTQRWDIFCTVLDPAVYPGQHRGYVLENLKFEEGTFENTYLRPCGPSLIIETVFYMAVHLGVKNIFTVGVDGGTPPKGVVTSTDKNLHIDTRPKNQQELDFKNWEIDITREGTGPLYDWLQQRGINLFIVGDTSIWNSKIPRISFDEGVNI